MKSWQDKRVHARKGFLHDSHGLHAVVSKKPVSLVAVLTVCNLKRAGIQLTEEPGKLTCDDCRRLTVEYHQSMVTKVKEVMQELDIGFDSVRLSELSAQVRDHLAEISLLEGE